MRFCKDPIEWADRATRGCFGGDGGSGGGSGDGTSGGFGFSGEEGPGGFGSGAASPGSAPAGPGTGGDIGGFDVTGVDAVTAAQDVASIGQSDPSGPVGPEETFDFNLDREIGDRIADRNIDRVTNVAAPLAATVLGPFAGLAVKGIGAAAKGTNNRGAQTATSSPVSGQNRGPSTADQSSSDGTDGPGGGGESQSGTLIDTDSAFGVQFVQPSAAEIQAQEAEQQAFEEQAAQDAAAFEQTRLDVIAAERRERERVAEEEAAQRAVDATADLRSRSRPDAASSDPIRLLATDAGDDDDPTTPLGRRGTRFRTPFGARGLSGVAARTSRPILFGA